jgi:hypothetical protein
LPAAYLQNSFLLLPSAAVTIAKRRNVQESAVYKALVSREKIVKARYGCSNEKSSSVAIFLSANSTIEPTIRGRS